MGSAARVNACGRARQALLAVHEALLHERRQLLGDGHHAQADDLAISHQTEGRGEVHERVHALRAREREQHAEFPVRVRGALDRHARVLAGQRHLADRSALPGQEAEQPDGERGGG